MPRHQGVEELSFGWLACLALSLVLAASKVLASRGFVLASQTEKGPPCTGLDRLTSPNDFLALLPLPDPPLYKAFLNGCSLAAPKFYLALGIWNSACGLVSTQFLRLAKCLIPTAPSM